MSVATPVTRPLVQKHLGDGCSGRNIHAAMAGGFQGRRGQARADPRCVPSEKLPADPRGPSAGSSSASGEGRGWSAIRLGCSRSCSGVSEKNRALVAQINVDAGFVLQLMHELGIHARARGGERLKHAAAVSSGKSASMPAAAWDASLPRLSAFHDQNGGATLAQRDREREPDDSAADDDDVPRLHVLIVKQR